jgi:hypothetical protein
MIGSGLRHGGSSRRRWRRATLLLSAASLGWVSAVSGWQPSAAIAQQAPAAPAPAPAAAVVDERLDQAKLEALLAPIALYPDELLMQVLMASTYPLELVHAKRWLDQGQNAALRGDALASALEAQPWDPSVKSLVPFPDVLTMMNDQLEWTQQLGDALLAQQGDVLNAVQVLRGRAQAAGHLESGPQQTVTVNTNVTVAPAAPGAAPPVVAPPPQVIVIKPTQPNVVAVPVYDPSVVYGGWPYPATPPAYYPPPPGYALGSALLTGMAFAAGVALVGSLWGWASPGWGRGSVNVNVNRYNNINVNRTQINNNTWRHDATHRQGVAYRSPEVSNRYRSTASAPGTADRARSREEFRGRTEQAGSGGGLAARTPGAEARPGTADRAAAATRPAAGAGRPGTATRPTTREAPARAATTPSGRPQVQQPSAATRSAPQGMQGLGSGGQVRTAQQRGEASRTAAAAPSRAAPSGGARTGSGGARGR